MKVMDFLNTKGDAWGIKYYNAAYMVYTPSLQDNIIKIKFLKDGESGCYHIFTDSVKDVKADNMRLSDIKRYCARTMDCKQCIIKTFCDNNFKTLPNRW